MTSDSQILVVDDEERTRTFICEGLSALGITDKAICVSSAEEALAEADRTPIDLVISDVRMPGLNGLDLARYLHQSHPTIRVILVTGYSTRDIERAALALSVEALLKKPFALEVLGKTVQTALRRVPQAQSTTIAAAPIESVTRQIYLLKRDTGAQWIGLIYINGQVVADTGPISGIHEVIARIGYGGWAPMMSLIANRLGTCFIYVEGQPHDIYLTSVDRDHYLALVYDRRWQASRIGAVWLGARQAVQELARAISIQHAPVASGMRLPARPEYLTNKPAIEP